ncbi:hypothetical protein GCM10009541_54010 [Micromonospora gifhornensis]|uniref:Uncharacterized protein n=1 Tax=Micromonospora gifhornensis TaxID=84594 RepID=A0ABQ4IKH0_9ACTN|nr:hypothetical protein [Micromonospora gifhornensis]GIJ18390.1 hypothetical protein Vgi01_50740 [Micromonospora gifhornensis]
MWVSAKSAGSRLVVLVAATSLVATLAVGCTGREAPKAVGEHTAQAHAGSPTVLSVAGVTVRLPEGAVVEGTAAKLTVSDADGLPEVPDGISVIGHSVSVEVPGGIAKPATVTFPASAEIADQSLHPVVVWQDSAGGWRWAPTTYDVDQRTVSAEVDHFSLGFLGGIDVKKWASDRWNSFRNYITGRAGVAQPRCGDEAAARTGGIEVTSGSGDRVKWCFGIHSGRRVLKIANNTRTYLQMTYPASWKVIDGASVSFDAGTAARAIGAAVSIPRGTAARIVDGGDTLTLAVPAGASGRVTTETSVVAWLVSGIAFGIETYAAVAKAAGSTLEKEAKSAVDRFAVLLGATGQAASELDVLKSCLKGGKGLLKLDSAKVAWDVLELAWGCVPAYMKSQLEDVKIFAVGVILSMVGSLVGAILTAVHLLVTGARDLWDHIASLGGKSDAIYNITIADPSVSEPMTSAALVAYIKAGKKANTSAYAEGAYGPDQPYYPSPGRLLFTTPSGNMMCVLSGSNKTDAGISCYIEDFSFKLPPRNCGNIAYVPNIIGVSRKDGPSQGICTGGVPFQFYSNKIPYGSSIIDGPVGCRSGQPFLACADLTTGQGFVVNRKMFRMYGR